MQYFRLKADLSRFYHDARRYCWIFIDLTKIQQVQHVKQHINKLFDIREPFHLLLNDAEYLPPMEDVRILKENETILVAPGSGLDSEVVLSTSTAISNTDTCKNVAKIEKCNSIVHNEAKTNVNIDRMQIVSQDVLDVSNRTVNNTQPTSTNNTTVDMTFHTVIDDTEPDTDSKVTDYSNLTEDINVINSIIPSVKRKRIRKRRPKNKIQSTEIPLHTNEESEPKKPKIINSVFIPYNKHIRFDDTEEEENIARRIAYEISSNESNINKSCKFSTLLALRQCSTPITYTKKMKNEVKEILVDENLNKTKEDNNNIDNNLCVEENNKDIKCIKETEQKKTPIMTRKPQVGDVVAFKTFKLGADYTPQISKPIVGEVIDFCTQSSTYSFKILEGKQEIEEPSGKFSVPENEPDCDYDKISFNYSQLIEPRLVV